MPRPTPPTPPIHLPGTTLEGGGQLLRLSLSLSTLLSIPIHITSIRGNRSGGGGLKAQHLTSLTYLARFCGARVKGVGLKSKEIEYVPGDRGDGERSELIKQGDGVGGKVMKVEVKQNTPGSVGLVFQAVLPVLLFSFPKSAGGGERQRKIELSITGGTNVSGSPSYEYVSQVLLPMLERIGVSGVTCEPRPVYRGWSVGSSKVGAVRFDITPMGSALRGFRLVDRGRVVKVTATVIAPRDTERDFRDEVDVAVERYWGDIFGHDEGGDGVEPEVEVNFEDSGHEKRYSMLLVATTSTGMKLGRDWLYDRGIRAGKTDGVVREVVRKVLFDLKKELEHGGCVDEWMRDQLVVFQALAKGRSEVFGGRGKGRDGREGKLVEPSLHAKTARWVVESLLGLEFDEGGACEGIGFVPGGNEEKDEVVGDETIEKKVQEVTEEIQGLEVKVFVE